MSYREYMEVMERLAKAAEENGLGDRYQAVITHESWNKMPLIDMEEFVEEVMDEDEYDEYFSDENLLSTVEYIVRNSEKELAEHPEKWATSLK